MGWLHHSHSTGIGMVSLISFSLVKSITLDSVFVLMVTQPYYMRIFVDCYQEIMPQEIDKCFELLAE